MSKLNRILSTHRVHLKTHLFCSSLCVTLLSVSLNFAFAQAPARPDKIMSLDELRQCMKTKKVNETAAAALTVEQENFKRDQDAVKAEQAEINAINERNRARTAEIVAEREALAKLVSDMSVRVATVKTDAEKADYETDRLKLVERGNELQKNTQAFNAAQQALQPRVAALNQRIDSINERSRRINNGVAPLQKDDADWRAQCGNRRFREEDEVQIKKEMAAAK